MSRSMMFSLRLPTCACLCLFDGAGGSDLAVAITAASVALADAGIELFDLVPACRVVRLVVPRGETCSAAW